MNLNQERTDESYSNPIFVIDKDITGDITDEGPRDSDNNITDINVEQTTAVGESNNVTAKDDTKEENKRSRSRLRHLCTDKIFKAKVLKTVFILWTFSMFGWTLGITGPTLPDLQLITGANLQQASWLFTGWGIGYLVACGASGFVHRKSQPDIVLFIYNTVQALSTAALPWIPNIYVMVVLRAVTGYCNGGQDIELTAMLFSIWKSKAGPYFQLTHVFLSLGGVLSPFLVKPFLIQTSSEIENQDITDRHSNSSNSANVPSFNCSGTVTLANGTVTLANGTVTLINGTVTLPNGTIFKTSTDSSVNVIKETNVHFAYLISAVIMLTAALPFLVYFITGHRKIPEKDKTHKENTKKSATKFTVLVVSLLCIVSAFATALVDSLVNYLATFGILQLEWSQDMGSSMTSLHFAMYACGNLIGVFILKIMTSDSFIYLTYVASIASMALLYAAVLNEIPALQTFSVATNGLATSSILPTLFTWTQEAVTPISGMIASALLFAGAIGTMVNPIPLGYLMEYVTPMWYIYLSALEVALCFVIFIVASVISRRYIILNTSKNELDISKTNGEDDS